MAGQVIERGDRTFIVRIFMGRDGNGKRKYFNQTVHGTKKDALKVRNKLLRDKDLGLLADATNYTVDEYLDHWLEVAAKQKLRARTFNEYKSQLRRYVRPAVGHTKLAKLTPVAIQTLYSKMLEQGLSGRTVRLTHTILRSALKQAMKWRMIQHNPADAVDLPKHKAQEMIALSQDEASRFMAAAKESKWYLFLSLLLSTGLRPSEAIALRLSDIDLARNRLSVSRTLSRANGEWIVEKPKTKRSRRTVDLPPSLTLELVDYITELRRLGVREDDLLFTNEEGEPVNVRRITSDHFKPILERALLHQDMRLYDLRHTHATLLLIAGVHPKVVADRLGHADISLTLNTYSHVLPGMQRESAAKLDAMLYTNTANSRESHSVN